MTAAHLILKAFKKLTEDFENPTVDELRDAVNDEFPEDDTYKETPDETETKPKPAPEDKPEHTGVRLGGSSAAHWRPSRGADLLARLQRAGGGGEGELAYGDSVRVRASADYRHGTLFRFPEGANQYVFTWQQKGSVIPEHAEAFGTLEQAADYIQKEGFDEVRAGKKKAKPSPEADVVSTEPTEIKGVKVDEVLAPEVDQQTLDAVVKFNVALTKARKQLQKFGLDTWSPFGNPYLGGIRDEQGKIYKYGTAEYETTLYGEAKAIADHIIPYSREYHDKVYLRLKDTDPSAVSYMAHQLPKPLNELEGYKMFVLNDEHGTTPKGQNWTDDPRYQGHATTAILKDAEGNPYIAVFEVQGANGGKLSRTESSKQLARRIKAYADEKGLPVVLASSKTATDIYGREKVNATFTKAYSKGGWVRKAFNSVFGVGQENPSTPVNLGRLWMPVSEEKRDFTGVKLPTGKRTAESLIEAELGQSDLIDVPPSHKPAAVTIDATKVSTVKYPMFKEDQPKIGNYAQANAENMAKTVIFVVASIKNAWPNMQAYFESLFKHLESTGSCHYDADKKPDWAPLVVGKTDTIDWLWNNRRSIYESVMRAIDEDEKAGETGFIVYQAIIRIFGLGLPKAGFLTQLVIGKFGCIDSVNLNLLGAKKPSNLMAAAGNSFKNPSLTLSKDSESNLNLTPDQRKLYTFLYGKYSKGSLDLIKGYADYLAEIESEGVSCEVLWNVWCEVIANKIRYAGQPIDVKLPNQSEPMRVKGYKSVSKELLNRANKELQPWGTKKAASQISADHRRLITGESVKYSRARLIIERFFHGTSAEFEAFKPVNSGKNSTVFGNYDTVRHGIFFTPEKDTAHHYATNSGQGKPVVKEVELDINHLLDIRNGWKEGDYEAIVNRGVNGAWIDSVEPWELFEEDNGKWFVQAVRSAGYDGVAFNEASHSTGKNSETWVVFDPAQVSPVK